MSSSQDERKNPVGRGRGRGRPRESPVVNPGYTRPKQGSSGSSGSDEDSKLTLARPGSLSPPQTRPSPSLRPQLQPQAVKSGEKSPEGVAEAMGKLAVVDRNAPPERRGSRRGARPDELDYNLQTRPAALVSKMGTKGTPQRMLTNYYRLIRGPMWQLYGYSVSFSPEEDRNFIRKYLLRQHSDTLGAYIFDGMKMYTSKLLPSDNLTLQAKTLDKNEYTFTIKKSKENPLPGDPTYMHFYHLILRKCLFGMGLEELGRHFYDSDAEIQIPQHRLVLWPGYVTTLRQHEKDVMLCVEATHKVLRMDNVLAVIRSLQDACRGDARAVILGELKDCIVMTKYNRKTYHVDDVDFTLSPKSTFEYKGKQTPFHEFYQQKYNVTVTDRNQPLLVVNPSKRDLHRGKEGKINLIPELCQMTGLTDAMRANFTLMKELSKHLHMGPADRVKSIEAFMTRLSGTAALGMELDKWGVQFETRMAPVPGRILPKETMIFAKGTHPADDKADWTMAFRSQQMLTTVHLDKWCVLVPQRDAAGVDNLTKTMTKVAGPLGMTIRNPCEVFKLPDVKPQTYVHSVNSMLEKHRDLQMLFVILPNNKLETYAAVKKRLAVDVGVPSQCFVAKNVTSKGLMSIATKVVVQMNAKLGGEPWTIKVPLKNLMVVGFDVYHGAKGQKGGSIGAMVASLSPTLAKYYSTTSAFSNPHELSEYMRVDFAKCCSAYQKANGDLPERIILFRDGVGEGQLQEVYTVELAHIQAEMKELYTAAGKELPKFTFIVVTKKINTRAFAEIRGKLDNPPPGSVVDDVVTIPDRYDFFLVSCAARQGTVSPCCYNVLFDSQGLDPDKIQLLTYKMCHLYFNWSGTVAVPAPCQYAHKLAFITGTAYCNRAKDKLANLLHFL